MLFDKSKLLNINHFFLLTASFLGGTNYLNRRRLSLGLRFLENGSLMNVYQAKLEAALILCPQDVVKGQAPLRTSKC